MFFHVSVSLSLPSPSPSVSLKAMKKCPQVRVKNPPNTLARLPFQTALLGESEADMPGQRWQGRGECIWFLEKGNVCSGC